MPLAAFRVDVLHSRVAAPDRRRRAVRLSIHARAGPRTTDRDAVPDHVRAGRPRSCRRPGDPVRDRAALCRRCGPDGPRRGSRPKRDPARGNLDVGRAFRPIAAVVAAVSLATGFVPGRGGRSASAGGVPRGAARGHNAADTESSGAQITVQARARGE